MCVYVFSYNEYPNYVGATYPGKMCVTRYSAGITMVCSYSFLEKDVRGGF